MGGNSLPSLLPPLAIASGYILASEALRVSSFLLGGGGLPKPNGPEPVPGVFLPDEGREPPDPDVFGCIAALTADGRRSKLDRPGGTP